MVFWDLIIKHKQFVQEFEDIEVHKTSVSVSAKYKMDNNDRLYLGKEGQELYVDFKLPCPQHQLDGVRFLYRLFKLKQPGAILNDPSGYGKRVQVALFISAICPLLNDTSNSKQVLILCDDSYVEHWRQLFEEWSTSTCFNDISTNSTTLSKNLIHINPHKDGATLSRRQWGVLVVDSEDMTKDLQIIFKADFKIWVTNVDLKQTLPTFTAIYNWVNPSNKFKLEDFTPKNNSLKEVVGKSLLFDAFLEDTVLRRNDFNQLFHVPEKPKRVNSESPKKKSIKNKDPTGTKVKRTKKRKIVDEITQNYEIQNTSNKIDNHIATNSGKDTSFSSKSICDLDTMEVGTYDVDYKSPAGKLKRSKILAEDTQIDFSIAVNDIVENENTILDDGAIIENDKIHNEDEIIITETRKDSQIIDFTTINEKDCTNDNIETKKQVRNNEVQRTKEECNKGTFKVSKQTFINLQNSGNEVINNLNKNSDHQINESKSVENEIDESSKNTLNVKNSADELNLNKNGDHQIDESKSDKNEIDESKCDKNEIDESKSDKNQTDTNKDVQNNDESANKKKSVMSSLKEMEDKLLEYERKAAERYKGSFLDSLF